MNKPAVPSAASIGTGVLLELGLHNPLAAAIGRGSQSEWALALELLAQLPAQALRSEIPLPRRLDQSSGQSPRPVGLIVFHLLRPLPCHTSTEVFRSLLSFARHPPFKIAEALSNRVDMYGTGCEQPRFLVISPARPAVLTTSTCGTVIAIRIGSDQFAPRALFLSKFPFWLEVQLEVPNAIRFVMSG